MLWLTVVSTCRGYSSACDPATYVVGSTRYLLPFPFPPFGNNQGHRQFIQNHAGNCASAHVNMVRSPTCCAAL
ncbi:hypothetical protein J3E74DRAFT_333523 [Bipolaris maydis]|nr:hypothetical protein J3E74DRAFT_333523 [Bipolaris maydis]